MDAVSDNAPPVADDVALSLSGDHLAYARLYDRFAPLIRAICFDACGNLAQAQDLCQETFLRAYRKLRTLREHDRFPGWLAAMARHVGREWKRSRRRDRHQFGEVPEVQASGDTGTGEEELSRLRAALDLMLPRERLALHLFYLLEEPAEQARAVMGLSRAGFYKLLDRARSHLAQALTQKEKP